LFSLRDDGDETVTDAGEGAERPDGAAAAGDVDGS
jgi:hypothetical protein